MNRFLRLQLAAQTESVQEWLKRQDDPSEILARWTRFESFRAQIPGSVSDEEADLFVTNLRAICRVLATPGQRQTTDLLQSLSKREREVLALVGRGLSTKEIATDLELSVHTVENHRRNIAEKLDIRGVQLVLYAARLATD